MKKLMKYPKTVLSALVLLQTALLINSRALWFSDEIRYADAYSNLVHLHKWVVLFLNGEPYPDKPPVYFWFVWIIQTITRLDIPSAMFLASAVSGVIYLLCHYYFAMQVTRDREISFVSGVILLTNFYFLALLNYIRMDMLFASFIILSSAFMYRYLAEDRPVHIYTAFLLASVATLIKGPLGILFPLLVLIAAGIQMKKTRRVFSRHLLGGLFVCAVPVLMWLVSIISIEGKQFAENLLYNQVLRRATHTWHHQEPIYYYLYALPLAWLPWFLIFFTSFKKVKSVTVDVFKGSKGGTFFLTFALSGFILLSALSGKIAIYALPLFSPIAIYVAYILKNSRQDLFWAAAGLFFIIAGIAVLFIGQVKVIDYPVDPYPVSSVAIVCGAVLVIRRKAADMLPVFVVCVILFFNTAGLTVVRSCDNIMSPEKQALVMKKYIADGYYPMAFRVYSGLYSYYAGTVIDETKEKKYILSKLASDQKVVLGIAEKHWMPMKRKPENVEIVDRQWVAGRYYLLVINHPSGK